LTYIYGRLHSILVCHVSRFTGKLHEIISSLFSNVNICLFFNILSTFTRPRTVSVSRSTSRSWSRSRSRSFSPSDRSYSRSRSRSRGRSWSTSPSRSRSRSRTRRSTRRSPSRSRSRARSPSPRPAITVSKLTRNVQEEHLREIFGEYGTIRNIELEMIPKLKIHRGTAIIEYESMEEAEKAIDHMNGGQLDGNELVVSLYRLNASNANNTQNRSSRYRSLSRDRDRYTGNGRRGRSPGPYRSQHGYQSSRFRQSQRGHRYNSGNGASSYRPNYRSGNGTSSAVTGGGDRPYSPYRRRRRSYSSYSSRSKSRSPVRGRDRYRHRRSLSRDRRSSSDYSRSRSRARSRSSISSTTSGSSISRGRSRSRSVASRSRY
jgi:RNA-binding protein with serine-rich domain 1